MLTTDDKDIFDRAYMLHNAGRLPEKGSRWEHATLGWNCRPTEYQAALLLHRFGQFPAQQEVRAKNFDLLRQHLQSARSVHPLTVHSGVKKHGMYMFVMRYQPDACSVPLADFLRATAAEGAPFYRCYESTIANQPAMRSLAERRPDYIRALPTPVADQAVKDTFYIDASVFLGSAEDMEDIAAAVLKVERHYSGPA
jgi:dTDP-4-amino-4,6-dideoxygalactose transaminase